MSLSIKFSHRYDKMPPGFEKSKLLGVFVHERSDLSDDFIEYDTVYDGRYYPLPKKGTYMILLLLSKRGFLWTTIRRFTPQKFDYYDRNVGKMFHCQIREESDGC